MCLVGIQIICVMNIGISHYTNTEDSANAVHGVLLLFLFGLFVLRPGDDD